MGSVYTKLNQIELSREAYENALEFDPYLKEAHFALGMWHYKHGNDLSLALKHLDNVKGFSPNKEATIHGWKMAIFFELKDNVNAFREINALLGQINDNDWILSWCAKHVSEFGKVDVESARKSSAFWHYYLSIIPSDVDAETEYLLCQSFIKFQSQSPDICYIEFKNRILNNLDNKSEAQQAFIWDRIGHWAQDEENWEEAIECFRKACELEPNYHYGYCLGVVLNHMKRYEEALPLLILQAQKYQPDAQSWYQVAKAYNGLNDIKNTISSFQKTLELNPEFEIAWVNLGGALLNNGELLMAKQIWDTAMKLFPENEDLKMIKQKYTFFG